MARPKKIGLDYFPVDVNFNDQIQALESVHHNDGLVWLLKFWQAAYKTEYGEVVTSGLFGDILANNSRVTTEKQNKIIEDCLQLGLLIKIKDGIYSSNGVKKRIGHVSKEREYALNSRKTELLGEQSPNNPQTIPKQRGKVKERKVKERKVNKEEAQPDKPVDPRYGIFIKLFDQSWKNNREGNYAYQQKDFGQLKILLAKDKTITSEQFEKALKNCLDDSFQSKNFSLCYAVAHYPILLNLKNDTVKIIKEKTMLERTAGGLF